MIKSNVLLFLFVIFSLQGLGQNTLVKTGEEDLFRTGLDLLAHQKYAAAREVFQQYADLHKDNLKSIDAEYYVAYSAMNLFNSDAETLFENFIANYPYHSKSALAYFELANFNYTNKKYDKAIEYFEKVDISRLSADQQAERNFKLGYAYFMKKDLDKSLPLFDQVKRSENKHTYAASYYAGYIELRQNKYEEAKTDLLKAEQNDYYKPLVPVLMANIYYRQGRYDELISYAEQKLSGNVQGKDELSLLIAEAYFYKKDYRKAAEYYRKYKTEFKAKPNSEVSYRLGYSEYKINDYDAAINDLKLAAGTKDSISQSAAYYLGVSYLKKNNKDFALTSFDQASKGTFSAEIKEEASFNYGKVLFDLQRYHDAIVHLKNFSKEFPESHHTSEVQDLLSEAYLRTNNHAEALTYIESLSSRSPRINAAYQRVAFHTGVKFFNNGKYQEAIQMFEKSASYPVDNEVLAAAHFWKGEAYSIMKDYDNAIRNYSLVFQNTDEKSEYHLKSRYGIGYAYFNTKQYDKAFPHFRAYVDRLKNAKDRQNYDDALLRLADLSYESKKYEDAIRYYNEAIAGKITDMDYAYYTRGVVYGILEKIPEAKSSLDIVIKNYPQSVYHDDAIFEKARLNSQVGNFDETIAGFTKLINEKQGSPYVPYALLQRGVAYTSSGKNNEAIRDYENILTNYAGHPVAEDAFIGLQDLYGKTGRTEDFKKWIHVMENADPKSSLIVNAKYNDAKNLYFEGKYKQAIDAFNGFISTYPDNANVPEVRFYLSDAYTRTDDFDNAIKSYQVLIGAKDPAYYARSIQKVADIQFRRGAYPEAKTYYNLLFTNARNKKDRLVALTGLMETHFISANYDSAIVYAQEIIKTGNISIDAESRALLISGKSHQAKQEYDKAIDYFINTVNLAKDVNGAEAKYLIAQIQYDQKKYKQSLETLRQMSKDFGDYDEWIGRAFLLAAYNYIALDEIFQAKATLKSIIENSPHQESVEKAKQKLSELEGKEGTPNE